MGATTAMMRTREEEERPPEPREERIGRVLATSRLVWDHVVVPFVLDPHGDYYDDHCEQRCCLTECECSWLLGLRASSATRGGTRRGYFVLECAGAAGSASPLVTSASWSGSLLNGIPQQFNSQILRNIFSFSSRCHIITISMYYCRNNLWGPRVIGVYVLHIHERDHVRLQRLTTLFDCSLFRHGHEVRGYYPSGAGKKLTGSVKWCDGRNNIIHTREKHHPHWAIFQRILEAEATTVLTLKQRFYIYMIYHGTQLLFTDFSNANDNLDQNAIIHILEHVGMPQTWTTVIADLMQNTEQEDRSPGSPPPTDSNKVQISTPQHSRQN
ncbi:hypothetical protein Pelo_1437 [Pelomyxa schiedti]|nr:hypothetical protein Pelo_1437 [Pelomyxa schiedti]